VSYETIVIGAGVNGLVAAHTLARAGQRVLVLEQRAERDDSPDIGWVPPPVIRDLSLDRHGLVIRTPDPWISAALPTGGRLDLSRDLDKSVVAIGKLSQSDAAKWPEFSERMRHLGAVLEALYVAPPPDVETTEVGELLRLGAIGARVRLAGAQTVTDLLRILPMASAELLDDWFESDALKGVLGAASVMHLRQGPRSGGTAFNLLHHHVGSPAGVFRPPLSNATQVLSNLPGVELRRGAAVTRISVKGHRATGVVLANGEELFASTIVSSADPRRTMLGLLAPGWLDPEFGLALQNIKCRGVAATVTLTLDREPDFSTLLVAPSLPFIERAYDDAKYGRVSKEPWLEARADGRKVVVHVQYAPYALRDGMWDDARRNAFGDLVVERLTAAAPSLRGAVRSRDVLTAADAERRYGLTEGQAYHGELTLDQILFMRPVPGWGNYRTPIEGLFLGGAGTHPGGAVAGASGRNAARAVINAD
jgi:phytoene dehydrogenase-like protein